MITEVARPCTTWLLSLELLEECSVWNKCWFKIITASLSFCRNRTHMQPFSQHCVGYPFCIDVCWKTQSNSKRKPLTVTVKLYHVFGPSYE